MKTKKMFFGIFATTIMLFFTACENTIFYDYSDVIPNSKPTPENPIGTGLNEFKVDFTTSSNPLPANFQFQKLSYNYAGAADTTGDGFEVTFTLTVDVPATLTVPEGSDAFPEESQNVKVTVDPYEKTEGIDNFPLMYFNGDNNLRQFTFTPSANTVELTAIYKKSDIVQRGILPLAFTYNEKVYKNTMPRKLQLSVFSNGTVDKTRVVLQKLIEQTDNTAVVVDKPDNFVLTIQDKDLESTKNNDYTIPLVMNLSGVYDDYPVNLTAKDSENIAVSNIVVAGGMATFDLIHSGINKFQLAKGAVTLTVNSPHADKYSGLPFDIIINTQRNDAFKYYIDDNANDFTVSTSTDNLFDTTTKKYYTEVTIPSMEIADATPEDKIIYEIFRKDETSADFKSIDTRTISVNETFIYKDYDAFILTNPEQEYKIKLTHDGCSSRRPCSSEIVKKGSRMLTDREIFLAAMDSMRYALIDKNTHSNASTATDASGGTFKHASSRHGSGKKTYYKHIYTVTNYEPYLIDLTTGSFTYEGIEGSFLSDREITIQTKTPFTGTVNFTSPYGNGSIKFNSININNNTWSNPGWANGSFTVTVAGNEVTYDKNAGVPFGFYMKNSEFLGKLLIEGNYTQK